MDHVQGIAVFSKIPEERNVERGVSIYRFYQHRQSHSAYRGNAENTGYPVISQEDGGSPQGETCPEEHQSVGNKFGPKHFIIGDDRSQRTNRHRFDSERRVKVNEARRFRVHGSSDCATQKATYSNCYCSLCQIPSRQEKNQ